MFSSACSPSWRSRRSPPRIRPRDPTLRGSRRHPSLRSWKRCGHTREKPFWTGRFASQGERRRDIAPRSVLRAEQLCVRAAHVPREKGSRPVLRPAGLFPDRTAPHGGLGQTFLAPTPPTTWQPAARPGVFRRRSGGFFSIFPDGSVRGGEKPVCRPVCPTTASPGSTKGSAGRSRKPGSPRREGSSSIPKPPPSGLFSTGRQGKN